MLNKDFYRAFEEQHRGSRELIKNRISVYLPFVRPLQDIYEDSLALDIGCGRGEWIELLNDNGISAQGVDLDDGMLQACHELKFDVLQKNGITHLQEQKDESLIVVSAFHVIEHISFEELQRFVEEAHRVLKPGGILILETPNPENIKVATENFYLDPTHIKPIPSQLLSFIPEFYSYYRTKVLRLQENKNLLNENNITLQDVINGASPDYAVVAQKMASKDILNQFDEVFKLEYGLPLSLLTEKFENRLQAIEQKANEAETKANEAEIKASKAEIKASKAETKASEVQARTIKAEIRVNEAWHNFHTIENSNSWKITKPLRISVQYIKKLIKFLKGNV